MSDQEEATIVVLRTFDAKKVEIKMNMSDSLNALKDAISEHPDLGPLQKMHQRIFHLGRELKTGGRSLAKLGVGRFRVYMVHLAIPREHRQQPPTAAASAAAGKEETSQSNNKRSSSSGNDSLEDIHIDDEDDDDVVEIVAPKRRRVAAPPRAANAGPQEVISLDDSDDDDDDDEDDDRVEIIEAQVRQRYV